MRKRRAVLFCLALAAAPAVAGPAFANPDNPWGGYLLELPGTDRGEVQGYFEKAGMLDWCEKLIAGL